MQGVGEETAQGGAQGATQRMAGRTVQWATPEAMRGVLQA